MLFYSALTRASVPLAHGNIMFDLYIAIHIFVYPEIFLEE